MIVQERVSLAFHSGLVGAAHRSIQQGKSVFVMTRFAARGQNLPPRADETASATYHGAQLWRILRHFRLAERIDCRSADDQGVGSPEIHNDLRDAVQVLVASAALSSTQDSPIHEAVSSSASR